MQFRRASGRWLPTESVVVVSHTLMNSRVVEDKRPVNYGAWQVGGHVARAANGELFVMVMLIEPPQVVVLRSYDGGRSWSKPTAIWTNDLVQERNASVRCLHVLRSGRILGVVQQERQGVYDAPNFLRCVYSDDGGRSWQVSAGTLDIDPFWTVSVPTNLFEDEDGHLVMPVEGLLEPIQGRDWINDNVPMGVGYMRSRDGGQTWPERWVALRSSSREGSIPGEQVTVPLSGGRWLMLLYMRQPDATFRSVSQDRGRNWSRPLRIGPVNCNHGALRLPDGGILLHGNGAGGLLYKVSYDEGRSWDYEGLLDPAGDCAMSSVVLDDRTIFILHGSPTGPPHHAGYYYAGVRGVRIQKA